MAQPTPRTMAAELPKKRAQTKPKTTLANDVVNWAKSKAKGADEFLKKAAPIGTPTGKPIKKAIKK